MIYSKASAYAIRAMTRLALLRPDGYVPLEEICQDGDLPRDCVAKIFGELVRQRLLTSSKGRGGGFALTREPAKVSLLDIIAVFDGTEWLDACAVGLGECNAKQPCPMHDHFEPLRQDLRRFLERSTLADATAALRRNFEKAGKEVPKPKSRSKPLWLGKRISPPHRGSGQVGKVS